MKQLFLDYNTNLNDIQVLVGIYKITLEKPEWNEEDCQFIKTLLELAENNNKLADQLNRVEEMVENQVEKNFGKDKITENQRDLAQEYLQLLNKDDLEDADLNRWNQIIEIAEKDPLLHLLLSEAEELIQSHSDAETKAKNKRKNHKESIASLSKNFSTSLQPKSQTSMMDTLALNGPLVSELLALLAMLNSTMQCLKDLGLQAQVTSEQPRPAGQLEPLAQQLQQLHRVGLKLSTRWDRYQDEDDCKSEFIQSLACEVRNFVSIVLSTLGALERHGEILESTRRLALLAMVKQSIQDLTCLLEEAATLQGMSGFRHQARLSSVNIEKLCESIIREKKITQPERLVHLIRKGKSRMEQIDEVWFRQTLNKVLDNAIAYSPRNSVVILKLVWSEDKFTIQIQDLGIGIPPEEQSHVFKPFYRAGNARHISGAGLGLAIAQQAMNLQGGSIKILSKVGTGTTISLGFPLSRETTISKITSQDNQFRFGRTESTTIEE